MSRHFPGFLVAETLRHLEMSLCGLVSYRQINVKGAALAELSINIDETMMARDCAIGDGKPETSSFRWLLGCEERLKDMLPNVFIHSRPTIRNCDADIVFIFNLREVPSQVITCNKRGAQSKASPIAHGITGIQAEI